MGNVVSRRVFLKLTSGLAAGAGAARPRHGASAPAQMPDAPRCRTPRRLSARPAG